MRGGIFFGSSCSETHARDSDSAGVKITTSVRSTLALNNELESDWLGLREITDRILENGGNAHLSSLLSAHTPQRCASILSSSWCFFFCFHFHESFLIPLCWRSITIHAQAVEDVRRPRFNSVTAEDVSASLAAARASVKRSRRVRTIGLVGQQGVREEGFLGVGFGA